tara:strand:+ start:4006 stop:4380 length:375 start_codon:yes stop_codon:yes gene_type:complete
MLNKILIGIIVVMFLGGSFLYNKNQELVKLNAAYEVRDAEQQKTIEAIQKNMQRTSAELTGLQARNQQYEEEMAEYLDIFRRHNLAKLASAKPGMIETRVNNKTKEVFDGIEEDSKRISDLNSN